MRKEEKRVSLIKIITISAGVALLIVAAAAFLLTAAIVIPAVRTASETSSILFAAVTKTLLPDAASAMHVKQRMIWMQRTQQMMKRHRKKHKRQERFLHR